MGSLANVVRFLPTAGSTTDWTVSSAVTGYQTPAQAGAINAAIYAYRAESGDLNQWEIGYGAYTVAGTVLARTTVLANSSGTTAKISFTGIPQVAIVALADHYNPIDGALFGLGLSTAGSSTTFTVATGWCADSTAAGIMRLYASLAKTTSAWAVGAAAGSLDTGVIAASTWYHVFVIKRLDTGVTDVLVSLSATAPTMPANYTLFRRIGAMKTNGSSQWTLFSQLGDEFLWDVPSFDLNTVSQGTTPILYVLQTPPGVKTNALMRGYMTHATAQNAVLISSPDVSSSPANNPSGNDTIINSIANGLPGAYVISVRTDLSAQVRIISSAASTTLQGVTYGWIDTRGRLF